MALRLTGLMSGIDTESVIQELVAAKQTKVDDAKKAQTKLEWKQDAWKELNTKLKNLQSKYINNMRFSTAYSKKTTSVSNSSIVSVITGEDAVNSVQSLKVISLAKTAYLTGAELENKSAAGGELTALSTLSDLGIENNGTISLTVGGETTEISVTKDMTISDFLNKVKETGLNASFDAKNQRVFVSAKESGADSDFSFTVFDADSAAALSALGLYSGLDEATKAEYEKYAAYYVKGSDGKVDAAATIANMRSLIDEEIASRVNNYLNQYKELISTQKAADEKIQEIKDKYGDSSLKTADEYKTEIEKLEKQIAEKEAALEGITDSDEIQNAKEELQTLQEQLTDLNTRKSDAETLAEQEKIKTDSEAKIHSIASDDEGYIEVTSTIEDDGTVTYSATARSKLTTEVENGNVQKAEYAAGVIIGSGSIPGVDPAKTATKISGEDAEIQLNGATFTGSDNVFEINGLTLTVLGKTADDETVTITTQDDVDGIYDMVKDFLKEYNAIINEMDKLYNADSASGYEPLTDEEKEAMSESEVEKYEQKIKDALLRRDSDLNTISGVLKSVMSSGYEINGKTMYLSDFGINTLGYFSAADNEKNAYHIDGDEDDEATSGNADVLKGMIGSDPSTVISFFSELSRKLYEEMTNQSKSVDGYRTFGNFYDDKKMKADYEDYNTKIAELEEKLADYEDKWYAKFAAMETAMAKMQNNASAVTSLLGG